MSIYSADNRVSKGDTYWAADSIDRVTSEALNRASSFYNVLSQNYYLDQLVRNWLFYHGQYNATIAGDTHRVSFTGEEGELASLAVNHFRNIGQHILNMITANRPVMEARAVNTDYKSLAQTYLANGILDYYMREKALEDCIRRATEMAVVLGSGFVRLEWNATSGELYDFDPETGEKNFEGEIEFNTLSPFDVVFDGTKESWDQEWILVRTFQNRFNLAAKYPELKEKILGMQTKNMATTSYRLSMFSNDQTDDIPVYELFHKRTEAMPDGRYILFLDADLALLDMPLPYRQIPIFRISAGEYMGTPYGYTPMFDLFPLQEAVNSLYSTILTNQSAFGVQNLFVPRGSDLNINSLEGALNIIEGNEKPEALALTATSPEIFSFLQTLETMMETISGVNSVTRGNPEASLKSGTALALVQSMSLQFISGLQHNYVKLIEQIGTSLISILKDYAKTPKTISLVGKNNRPMLKEFTSDSIQDINRVIVTVGNPLARTTAGRVQMAEQMLQMGLIKNPQEYFQVINTGAIETMYESDMNELLLIKRENEFMMEGKTVMADIFDTHKLHIMEHRGLLSDPELRMDPVLRKVVQDHMSEHIDMLRNVDPDVLMMTGQEPIQNPQAQQGAQGAPMDQMMQPPSGMPSTPEEMIKGQGNPGGSEMPNMPTPPAPFENMPTNPADMMSQ